MKNSSHLLVTLATAILLAATSIPAHANYDANRVGIVTSVLTYPSDGRIYFTLENQPDIHPMCDRRYFAIDASGDPLAINRLYARLLVAFSSKEPINIGYDSEGDCAHTHIRVHRVG